MVCFAATGDGFAPSTFNFAGALLTGVGPVPVFAVVGVVVVALEAGAAAFLMFGVFVAVGEEVGSGFLVPIGVRVRVAVFETSLAGVLVAVTGVFFTGVTALASDLVTGVFLAGVTPDGVVVVAAALLEAAGSGFFVPIGVRAGAAFAGVVVVFAVVVAVFEVLLSFAGAFLTGVAVFLVAAPGVVDVGAAFFNGVVFGAVLVFAGVELVGFFAGLDFAPSANFATFPTLAKEMLVFTNLFQLMILLHARVPTLKRSILLLEVINSGHIYSLQISSSQN